MANRLVKTTVNTSYNPPQRRKKTKQTPTASAFKGLNSNQLRKILGEVTGKP